MKIMEIFSPNILVFSEKITKFEAPHEIKV